MGGEQGEKDSLVEDILAGARGEKLDEDEPGVRVDFGEGGKERMTVSPITAGSEEDEGLA